MTPDRSAYLTGLVTGTALTAVAAVLLVLPYGMWIGQRDATLLHQADRHAAVSLCQAGERAVLITGRHPSDDVWLCTSGSGRLLNKARAPLAGPLAKGDER